MDRYRYRYFKMRRSTKRFVFLEFINLFCSYIRVCFQLDAFVSEHAWHKALLMGYSMRFELTRVCSLNGFQCVMVFFMNAGPSFFLDCVSLKSTLPLIYFWYLIRCVCVCVCVGVFSDFTYSYFFSVYVWMCVLSFFVYIYIYIRLFPVVCVCVCVLECFRISLIVIFSLCMYECVSWVFFFLYIYIYIYVCFRLCVCVCVCVCVCWSFFGFHL